MMTHTRSQNRLAGVFGMLAGGVTVVDSGLTAADLRPAISVSAGWDSAYVSEGRDNLDDGGLGSGTVDVVWLGFDFSVWIARGDRVDYREYNLGAGRSFMFGPLEATIDYTRLEFGGTGRAPGDNELGLTLGVALPGKFLLDAGARYSTRADGTFLELRLQRPWETGTAGILLAPFLALGIDHGYVSVAHDGPNHIEGGLVLDCPLGPAVTLSAYVAHCRAQRDVRLEGGGDVTWGGVSIAVGF